MNQRGLEIETATHEAGSHECLIVTARGEIDLSTAEQLRAALEASECRRAGSVIVDLQRVPFVDSSGLGVLLAAARDLRAFAVVVDGQSSVRRLFELVELGDRLDLHESRAEALEAQAAADD